MLLISMILATDAFVLSLSQGLRMERVAWGRAFRFSGVLGFFQGGMLLAGWTLGQAAGVWLSGWYPWLVFVLLFGIGGNRIRCGLRRGVCVARYCRFSLLPLALILSLDAFSVGVGLSILPHAMVTLASLAAGVGMGMAFGGLFLGRFMGDFPWIRPFSECAGGVFILALAFRALPLSSYLTL
jgi:putative Mn2+ efflux pump MntP